VSIDLCWADDDLRKAACAVRQSTIVSLDLLALPRRQSKSRNAGPKGDWLLAEIATRALLPCTQQARDAIRPLAKELILARTSMNKPIPAWLGVSDGFALGSIHRFGAKVLNSYCVKLPDDHSSRVVVPPKDKGNMSAHLRRFVAIARRQLAAVAKRHDLPTIPEIDAAISEEIGAAMHARAEAATSGANGANTLALFPGGIPDDQRIRDLVVLLHENRAKPKQYRVADAAIARKYLKLHNLDDRKANSLLTRIRRDVRRGLINLPRANGANG
jgi:hypothetical protein